MRGVSLAGICAVAWLSFAACSPAPSVAPAATPSASPSSSASSPTAQATATPAQSAPLPAACLARDLRVRGGRAGGGTGTAHADLFFTNAGAAPCSLSGEPSSVEFLTASGAPLRITPTGPLPDAVPPAVLVPGVRDAASVAYNWSNWCGRAPGPLRVRVGLPSGGSISGSLDGPPEGTFVPRCDHPESASALQLLWGFANPTP